MFDSSTQAVNARRIYVVAERATTHFGKPDDVRMQARSTNSLDDRLDSSSDGGSVDNASHSSRRTCSVQ